MTQMSFDFPSSGNVEVAVEPVSTTTPPKAAVTSRARAKRVHRDAVISAPLPVVASAEAFIAPAPITLADVMASAAADMHPHRRPAAGHGLRIEAHCESLCDRARHDRGQSAPPARPVCFEERGAARSVRQELRQHPLPRHPGSVPLRHAGPAHHPALCDDTGLARAARSHREALQPPDSPSSCHLLLADRAFAGGRHARYPDRVQGGPRGRGDREGPGRDRQQHDLEVERRVAGCAGLAAAEAL